MRKYLGRLKEESFILNEVKIEQKSRNSNSHNEAFVTLASVHETHPDWAIIITILFDASRVELQKNG